MATRRFYGSEMVGMLTVITLRREYRGSGGPTSLAKSGATLRQLRSACPELSVRMRCRCCDVVRIKSELVELIDPEKDSFAILQSWKQI